MGSIFPVTQRPLVAAKNATVWIPNPIHALSLEHAKARFGTVLTHEDATEDAAFQLADGMILRQGKMGRDSLLKAHKLLAISRTGAGFDSIDAPTAQELGIPVMALPGMNAYTVAELTLTLALNLLRRIKDIDSRLQRGENVISMDVLGHSLKGRTVGLVGMGAIARAAADLFHHAFACPIHVFSPTSSPLAWTDTCPKGFKAIPHTRHSTLESLLDVADVVTLHCPFNPQTKNMFGEKEFRRMKKGSILVNVARGGIVDEKALEKALREGWIGGAGVDVWSVEPVRPAEYGTLIVNSLPNLICLPHIGSSTEESAEETCSGAVDQLADFLDGKGAKNRVI
ncbi:putative phosphoglycerate dehydrogenase [Mrakia frigida]|uniref:putative phosphoglycerate dehydrogenase n=1 Tax=Mrakia frigida TaxID=29902 RepID=UPI003FCC2703